MGTSTIIAALEMELAHVTSGTNTDTLNTKNGYIRKLLTTLEAHRSVENSIQSNESLSQQGKLDAIKKLATNETTSGFKWMKKDIKDMQEKDQRYRTQFFTVDSGIDNAVERMLRYTYLWSKLDRFDQSARVTQFLQSAERDDVAMMAAMLENPFGAMVNEDIKIAALTERSKRLTPNDFTNFEQNQILLEFLVVFRDWIAKWLFGEVGVALADIRASLGDEIPNALTGSAELVAK